MTSRTDRLLAVLVALLAGTGAFAASARPALAAFTGLFWAVAALLARRNWGLVRRRGSRWAGAYGGLSALAVTATLAFATSLSLPDGVGFALGLFVLGVATATTGVGVEMANECAAEAADTNTDTHTDAATGASTDTAEGGDRETPGR